MASRSGVTSLLKSFPATHSHKNGARQAGGHKREKKHSSWQQQMKRDKSDDRLQNHEIIQKNLENEIDIPRCKPSFLFINIF